MSACSQNFGRYALNPDIKAQNAFDVILSSRSRWANRHRRRWRELPAVTWEKDKPRDSVIEERLQAQFERDIHDGLRGGDLYAWGCKHQLQSSQPMKLIKENEWDVICINFTFRPWNSAYYVSGNCEGQLAFTQLLFCRRQIFKKFPITWLK